MSAGNTLPGRRVEPAFENLEKPGDYYFANGILWAILPHGGHARLLSTDAAAEEKGSRWQVTEEDDGSVTVSPSILQHAIPNYAPEWHGYLERGVWREV